MKSGALRLLFVAPVLGATVMVSYAERPSLVAPMPQQDTLRVLSGVDVEYRQPAQGVSRRADGSLRISTSGLGRGLHTLGEADAMRVATMMPGYSTMGDYASGLMIDGGDYTQTAYTLDGARVFFPYHFGGIFSDFNSQHIAAVEIGSRHHASPFTAGGVVSAFTSNTLPECLGLSANVGILASSATLTTPMWRAASIKASARLSYINWLYGGQLDGDDGRSRYGFDDFNLTVLQNVGESGLLKFSGFHSADRLDFGASQGEMDARLRWHNTALSVGYSFRTHRCETAHDIDYSDMSSSLVLGFPQVSFELPAAVSSLTARGTLSWAKDTGDSERTELSYRAEFCKFTPQSAGVYGAVDLGATSGVPDMHSSLFGIGASRGWRLGEVSALRFALRAALYGSDGYHTAHLDPLLSYVRTLGSGTLTATVSGASQYMHHMGLSDIGCASNFFLPATSALPAERSYGVETAYSFVLRGGASRPRHFGNWQIDIKAFYRRVRNAPEYSGSVLDLISDSYDPLATATLARGYNVGGNITASYDYGVISGWAGADLAVCRRRYVGAAGWHPSANEPLWSVKTLMQWRAHRRCDITAYFTVAAGRRYTAPEAIYVVAGNILTEYGPRNGAHLPTYQRLDLSLTWRLPAMRLSRRALESFINVSVLNVFGHRNIEMQYFAYDQQTNQIRLRQVCSLYRFLPSLSYSLRF